MKRGAKGFTLIELLVAILLVGICIAGVFGGLTALGKADAAARDTVLVQRLAQKKLADVALTGDPSLMDEKGDFSEEGYPDATWSMTYEQESDLTTLQRVTVTAERQNQSQTLTTLVYVPPATSTTNGTTTGGTQ
ncbi:MAG: prepilin-type N-terminal cleavage/methylation domain-containing protein [Armatimonas sp.]